MKAKIIETLHHASKGLQAIGNDFYIIGSSALILSGIDVGETEDIDILTSSAYSDKLQHIWADYLEKIL